MQVGQESSSLSSSKAQQRRRHDHGSFVRAYGGVGGEINGFDSHGMRNKWWNGKERVFLVLCRRCGAAAAAAHLDLLCSLTCKHYLWSFAKDHEEVAAVPPQSIIKGQQQQQVAAVNLSSSSFGFQATFPVFPTIIILQLGLLCCWSLWCCLTPEMLSLFLNTNNSRLFLTW